MNDRYLGAAIKVSYLLNFALSREYPKGRTGYRSMDDRNSWKDVVRSEKENQTEANI